MPVPYRSGSHIDRLTACRHNETARNHRRNVQGTTSPVAAACQQRDTLAHAIVFSDRHLLWGYLT